MVVNTGNGCMGGSYSIMNTRMNTLATPPKIKKKKK
jgi:hypothetical protein